MQMVVAYTGVEEFGAEWATQLQQRILARDIGCCTSTHCRRQVKTDPGSP